MINVSMTQHRCINFRRIKRKSAISLDGFIASTLVKPTFKQDLLAIDLDEVHRTRRSTGGSDKLNVHGTSMPRDQSDLQGKVFSSSGRN
jgi:hypothetical protein